MNYNRREFFERMGIAGLVLASGGSLFAQSTQDTFDEINRIPQRKKLLEELTSLVESKEEGDYGNGRVIKTLIKHLEYGDKSEYLEKSLSINYKDLKFRCSITPKSAIPDLPHPNAQFYMYRSDGISGMLDDTITSSGQVKYDMGGILPFAEYAKARQGKNIAVMFISPMPELNTNAQYFSHPMVAPKVSSQYFSASEENVLKQVLDYLKSLPSKPIK